MSTASEAASSAAASARAKVAEKKMKNMKKCTPVLDQALPLQHTAKKNEKEPSSFEHHTRQNYNFLVCEEDCCKSQHQEPWSES